MPLLFKQRQLWVPTLWGLLIIVTITMTMVMLTLKNMALFLAQNEALPSHYLIVEGWVSEPSLLQALQTFKNDEYDFIVTTGGPETREIKPEYNSYAEKAAAFIISVGFDQNKLIVIPTPASAQDRTYLSAVMVRDWCSANHIDIKTLTVFSSDVHARRTRMLYQQAFGENTEIGIIAGEPNGFELEHWWRTSEGAKAVLTESAGLLWTLCCFTSGEHGSHQEKWGLNDLPPN